MSEPDHLNRPVLITLGLASLAGGGYLLARSFGQLGSDQAHSRILGDAMRDNIHRTDDWFWPVVAMAGLALTFLALRWLREQLRTPRPGNLDLRRIGDLGETRLSASAAADALADDVEDYDGVHAASARLAGHPDRPTVDLRLDVADDTDLVALRQRVEAEALVRLRQALEVQHLETTLRMRLRQPEGRTVR